MFNLTLTTILSLIAPAVVAPLACLGCLRAIRHAESTRRPNRAPAPHIVLDSAASPLAAEPVRERSVA
jgi:hypothetical protein